MKINSLRVSVTYKVGLGGIDIPENIYQDLVDAQNSGEPIDAFNYAEAHIWLSKNIK